MTSKHKLQAVALLLITITSGNAQLWVENYQFGQPGLDSGKWTVTNERRVSFDSSSMRIYYNQSGGFPSVGAGNIEYELIQSLPLNHSWSVIQRFQCEQITNPGYFLIVNARIDQDGTNVSFVNNGQPLPISGISILENTYNWFGLTYDFEARTINQIVSTSSSSTTPDVELFQITGSAFSTIGKENSNATIHNQVTTVYNGDIRISNFNIIPFAVPEPSALSLLAIGLGGLAMVRRRRP
jgi:hypothetical protein